jgi:hypothetical protein
MAMTNSKPAGALLSVLMICQWAALSSAQAETVRDHRRVLGGVNLSAYCANTYGQSKAVNVDNTSGGWRCKSGRRLVSISVQAACRQQYGRNNLLAEVRSSDDSWVCINPRAR